MFWKTHFFFFKATCAIRKTLFKYRWNAFPVSHLKPCRWKCKKNNLGHFHTQSQDQDKLRTEERPLPTAAAELESYILPLSTFPIVNMCTTASGDDMHALHTDSHRIKQGHSQHTLSLALIAQTFQRFGHTRISSSLQGLQGAEDGMQGD